MTEINLAIDGLKGDALERFAALAGKSTGQLIESWIEDRLNHAVVVAMRAGGATWDAIASELGVSITQARRIYAAGSEFQPIGRDDVKAAEKYLKLLEDIKEITSEGDIFPVPDRETIDTLNEYFNALPISDDIEFPIPDEEDIKAVERYSSALPNSDDIDFPIPDEKDIEAVKRYSNALPNSDDIDFPIPDEETINSVERYAKAVRKD
jgi:hypothetical protein